MTTLQVDYNGDRIKTDILASGYIRQEIEEKMKLLIPSEIKRVCFDYWFIAVCDEWSEKFSNDRYEINGSCIKLVTESSFINNQYCSAFGTRSVCRGIFSWKIRFKTDVNWFCIGVIHDDEKLLKKHANDADYDEYDYGGSFFCSGEWYSDHQSEQYGVKCGRKDDVIAMTLDMDHHTISYKINDEDYGIAWNEMNKDKYRLVISNSNTIGDEIELL